MIGQMIALKRRCRFFDNCKFADETSRSCTSDVGYCGVYRTLSRLWKVKEKRRNEKGKK